MVVHIYRVGETDGDGLHEHTNRVTMLPESRAHRFDEPCLLWGTNPNVTGIRMKEVRWFWIEED